MSENKVDVTSPAAEPNEPLKAPTGQTAQLCADYLFRRLEASPPPVVEFLNNSNTADADIPDSIRQRVGFRAANDKVGLQVRVERQNQDPQR